MLGSRLQTAYVRASGGKKVGKVIARTLDSAIHTAVQRGLLLEDDPLSEHGVKTRTYRLPDQPVVRPRQLGPRSLEEVPPRELSQLMRTLAKQGCADSGQLHRRVLGRLGIRRLTTNAVDRLTAVSELREM